MARRSSPTHTKPVEFVEVTEKTGRKTVEHLAKQATKTKWSCPDAQKSNSL